MRTTSRPLSNGLSTLVAVWSLMVVGATSRSSATPTPSSCPDANCTSNDLVIGAVAVAAASNPECTDANDTVDLTVTHALTPQGGNTRYDVGIYVSLDGGVGGAGGSCLADILEPGNSTGSFTNDGTEQCRDINAAVSHEADFHDVPCIDADHDDVMDPVLICQSWANNDTQVADCDETNVIEGTSAHCNCIVVATNIQVPTMGQWALGALALLLGSIGFLFARKSM